MIDHDAKAIADLLTSTNSALVLQTAKCQQLQHALAAADAECADLERQLLQARRWSNLWKHVAKLYRGASDASRADELRLRGVVSALSKENGDLTRQVARLQDALAAKDREQTAALGVVTAANEWGLAAVALDDIDVGESMDDYLTATDTLRMRAKQLLAALAALDAAQRAQGANNGE